MTRLAVVGNPANRRVTLFTAAAVAAGLRAPEIFAWRDVLRDGAVPGPGTTVRIDSPGEDPEVDLLLRTLGTDPREQTAHPGPAHAADAHAGPARPADARVAEHGEIIGLAAAHRGLGAGLERIAAGGGRLLNPVDDVLTMGDKRRCHAVLRAGGVPVPEALPGGVRGWDELRAAMRGAGWGRVFVKPAHASSASGVLAVTASGARVSALTSVELAADGRLFNNLRVRRYDSGAEVAAIVDRLAVDGLHVERWFPKAGLGGRALDLRVVVTAGRPRHVVVRTSLSPMTNLHLGNARGDVTAVRAAAGEAAWAAAMLTCQRVAGCFPGSLHVGVDLMFGTGWRRHAVAEVNAFGDLLPGVRSGGHDTYAAQIAALTSGEFHEHARSPAVARNRAVATPADGDARTGHRGRLCAI